jgi:hypothetical protein
VVVVLGGADKSEGKYSKNSLCKIVLESPNTVHGIPGNGCTKIVFV